jgi:hypothetical protein
MELQVFVFDLTDSDTAEFSGMQPGTYCVHVADGSAILMFRPRGARSFLTGVGTKAE